MAAIDFADGWPASKSFSGPDAHGEMRRFYASAVRDAPTGVSYNCYERTGDGPWNHIMFNLTDEEYAGPDAKPEPQLLPQPRKAHRCQASHDGRCIRCHRKVRPWLR